MSKINFSWSFFFQNTMYTLACTFRVTGCSLIRTWVSFITIVRELESTCFGRFLWSFRRRILLSIFTCLIISLFLWSVPLRPVPFALQPVNTHWSHLSTHTTFPSTWTLPSSAYEYYDPCADRTKHTKNRSVVCIRDNSKWSTSLDGCYNEFYGLGWG